MQIRSRALGVALFAAAPLLLVTACAGDSSAGGSGNNLTPITGSSYVTIEPATTTTTTTSPPVDVNTLQPGQTSPVEQTYEIRSGDSLSKIAGLYGVEMQVICSYNQWTDCGGDHLLLPGETILIPPDSEIPADAVVPDGSNTGDSSGDAAGGDTSATNGECPTTYVIKDGDTSRIKVADQFGITFEQMDAANVNTPGYGNFIVGTPITIPCP